jgi:hypothetical protein
MRFRTGLLIGGVIGYLVARRIGERDPEDARPLGIRQAMARHPSTSRLADHGRKLAERAGFKGTEAILRARANIRRRLEPEVDDLPLN